jgi:hypothetical protein
MMIVLVFLSIPSSAHAQALVDALAMFPVAGDDFSVVVFAGNPRSSGSPINGTDTTTGGRTWDASPAAVFAADAPLTTQGHLSNGSVSQSAIIGGIPFDPEDNTFHKRISVEADLNPAELPGNAWLGLGFSQSAQGGYWSHGQVWALLRANGVLKVFANGTSIVLGSFSAPAPAFVSGSNHLKLEYSRSTGQVRLWLNDWEQTLAQPNVHDAGFIPNIEYVGFHAQNPGNWSTAGALEIDNFAVEAGTVFEAAVPQTDTTLIVGSTGLLHCRAQSDLGAFAVGWQYLDAGDPDGSYSTIQDGAQFSGATTQTLQIEPAMGLHQGYYRCRIVQTSKPIESNSVFSAPVFVEVRPAVLRDTFLTLTEPPLGDPLNGAPIGSDPTLSWVADQGLVFGLTEVTNTVSGNDLKAAAPFSPPSESPYRSFVAEATVDVNPSDWVSLAFVSDLDGEHDSFGVIALKVANSGLITVSIPGKPAWFSGYDPAFDPSIPTHLRIEIDQEGHEHHAWINGESLRLPPLPADFSPLPAFVGAGVEHFRAEGFVDEGEIEWDDFAIGNGRLVAPLVISQHPIDVVASRDATVSFSCTAAGGEPTLSYQWQAFDQGYWRNVDGAVIDATGWDSPELYIHYIDAETPDLFRCRVSDSASNPRIIFSEDASLEVKNDILGCLPSDPPVTDFGVFAGIAQWNAQGFEQWYGNQGGVYFQKGIVVGGGPATATRTGVRIPVGYTLLEVELQGIGGWNGNTQLDFDISWGDQPDQTSGSFYVDVGSGATIQIDLSDNPTWMAGPDTSGYVTHDLTFNVNGVYIAGTLVGIRAKPGAIHALRGDPIIRLDGSSPPGENLMAGSTVEVSQQVINLGCMADPGDEKVFAFTLCHVNSERCLQGADFQINCGGLTQDYQLTVRNLNLDPGQTETYNCGLTLPPAGANDENLGSWTLAAHRDTQTGPIVQATTFDLLEDGIPDLEILRISSAEATRVVGDGETRSLSNVRYDETFDLEFTVVNKHYPVKQEIPVEILGAFHMPGEQPQWTYLGSQLIEPIDPGEFRVTLLDIDLSSIPWPQDATFALLDLWIFVDPNFEVNGFVGRSVDPILFEESREQRGGCDQSSIGAIDEMDECRNQELFLSDWLPVTRVPFDNAVGQIVAQDDFDDNSPMMNLGGGHGLELPGVEAGGNARMFGFATSHYLDLTTTPDYHWWDINSGNVEVTGVMIRYCRVVDRPPIPGLAVAIAPDGQTDLTFSGTTLGDVRADQQWHTAFWKVDGLAPFGESLANLSVPEILNFGASTGPQHLFLRREDIDDGNHYNNTPRLMIDFIRVYSNGDIPIADPIPERIMEMVENDSRNFVWQDFPDTVRADPDLDSVAIVDPGSMSAHTLGLKVSNPNADETTWKLSVVMEIEDISDQSRGAVTIEFGPENVTFGPGESNSLETNDAVAFGAGRYEITARLLDANDNNTQLGQPIVMEVLAFDVDLALTAVSYQHAGSWESLPEHPIAGDCYTLGLTITNEGDYEVSGAFRSGQLNIASPISETTNFFCDGIVELEEPIEPGVSFVLPIRTEENDSWCPDVAGEYEFSASVEFSGGTEPFANIPTDVSGTKFSVVCRPPEVTLP